MSPQKSVSPSERSIFSDSISHNRISRRHIIKYASPGRSAASGRWNRRRRRGAATVEAALCFPIFFVLVCMILQIGHIYFIKNQIEIACREAARLGSTDNVTTDEVKAYVIEQLSPIIIGSQVSVSGFDDAGQPSSLSWEGKDDMTLDEQTEQQQAYLNSLDSAIQVIVRDASIYDTGGPYPGSEEEILGLPDVEVASLDPRDMFVVRAEVNYNTPFKVPGIAKSGVAFSDAPLLSGVLNLSSYAFTRHE